MNKTKYNEIFQEVLQGLNAEQLEAVNHIEGPVMVVAGPGTGKTQILSARIGKILMETDALPSNILCLTYTDSGAIAMRKRLLDFIGSEAYKVNIHTFHAFCNEIIQENISVFEKYELDPISDLERIELLKELIDQLPKGNPLKRYRGDVYYESQNLDQLFSAIKRESWKTEDLLRAIDVYVADIENREEFIYKKAYKNNKAGDKKPKFFEEEERMKKLKAAVELFPVYQQMMRKKSRYDFDDMINWVIKAFEDDPNLLAEYQERYQYILVDEYQDTSGSQNRLVELLISYWNNPNIFVVGDDDQSIFRFQGANVENMKTFARNRMKDDLKKVILVNNYRSTQPILDASRSLIDLNKERLIHENEFEGLTKNLVSSNPRINTNQDIPSVNKYLTQRHEMAGTVMRIEELIHQGVKPGNIAIIYRENRYGEELAKFLAIKNIPAFSKRKRNLLQIPFAKNIINILKYIDSEMQVPYSGDELLFEIMHYHFYNIPPIEIAKMSVYVDEKKYKEKYSLRQHIYEITNKNRDLFSDPGESELGMFSANIEKWISEVNNITLQQLFENVIREGKILSYIMKSPNKIELMRVLTSLFDFVKEETRRRPFMVLHDLVSLLELMDQNDISLSIQQITGDEQGVNLLTAHGSKGLEFEYVFLVGSNKQFWEGKRKNNRGYKIPDTVFESAKLGSDEEELRRLFYVAMTRAQIHLTISYAQYKNEGKEMEPSAFIEQVSEQFPLKQQEIHLSEEEMISFEMLEFTENKAPEIDKLEEEFLRPLLDRFVMNVTAMNNYLKCPLQFYYKNLVKIPSGKSESAEFGVAAHFALKRLFEKLKKSEDQNTFPEKKDFLRDFDWWMNRNRESFTREAFERRMEYGHNILSNYYDKYVPVFEKIVLVELNIKTTSNGIPIKGQIDKMEFHGTDVKIVDYKTGDADKAKEKFRRPNDKEPLGGDYWRQAVFYKILIDNYEIKKWNVIGVEFDFIEPVKMLIEDGEVKKYSEVFKKEPVKISDEEIFIVKQQIEMVWNKIKERDFYKGCGKKDCEWCNFVKDNELAVALHSTITEDELLDS